jgi:signal transduction histidine kinase
MGYEELIYQALHRAFPGIEDKDIQEVTSLGDVKVYPANIALTHEGELEDKFYILLEGEVRVTKRIQGEEERLLNLLYPGDFFGEMAILHNAARVATVSSITQVTVLVIHKEAFSNLLERSSRMSLAMVHEVSRRLRENDEMAMDDLRVKTHELSDAYKQLSELENARSEFLTTIAHELRTPLMAASGYMQIIRSRNLQGETLKSALDTVTRNLQDITSLVNDILFLQEMDLILPVLDPSDIGSVVSACVEQNRLSAEKNQVAVRIDIPPGIPQLPIDSKGLGRALNAILNNAVKFSPDGGDVLVEVGQRAGQVWVRIQDHGIGIAPETMPHIFERFYHTDRIGDRLFRGIGLGLPIARAVIEQHKGHIEVESQPGKGATFTVWLNCR